jgi:putative acetyltransferase
MASCRLPKIYDESGWMQNVIRKYEAGDLDFVMAIWESASKDAHPFLTSDFLDIERFNIPNIILPNTVTWVAEQDGIVVGFICIYKNEVGLLFVHPEFQGRGAGTALLDKAREDHDDLEVEVFKANERSCSFYAKYGFEFLCSKIHILTGDELLRLKFSGVRTPPSIE